MAESFSNDEEAVQNTISHVLRAGLKGGAYSFVVSTGNVIIAKELCAAAVEIAKISGDTAVGVTKELGGANVVELAKELGGTAVKLAAIYASYKLFRAVIDAAVKNSVGGEREDQQVLGIKPGSLHVLLRCFTDERFLEVLADYESGRIKERLQKEFSEVGIEIEGLKVEMENMEEVEKTRAGINKRSSYPTEVMAEGKATTRKHQGFHIDISEEHGNWLTVGELIRSIQKPISTYVDEIVKAFQEKLCKDLLDAGKCRSPDDCNKKATDGGLCQSCKCWFKKLEASHERKNPSWHQNCKSAKWSEDHWEVAKFFMPALRSNISTVKDAESTDISSLLNVLEWMNDEAFLGKTRVSVDLARKLRSQVRNTWAHAPQQEFSDDEKTESFSIATDFLEDLEKVFSHAENAKCLEHLKHLKNNGVTLVDESELRSFRLLHYFIKEEITKMKDEHSSDKRAIEEHEQRLKKLECALNECSQRISEVLTKINEGQEKEREPTNCLPDKLPMFTAREIEIQKVITFLKDEGKAVVSLRGGPGFGKTAIAIEVSHKLSEDHTILVVFSQLTTANTVDEMIRRLCLDVGVNVEDDPKPSLIFCLKNIKKKVILVMDDIDNLLEENTRSRLYDFIRLLRKNSNCQIVTTSRLSYLIPELSIGNVDVGEMEDKACMELLRKQCPKQDDKFLRRLAELCGNIPLAMCIAGSQVDDFEDSDELLQHLQKQPFKTLECSKSNQYVHRAIDSSFKMLNDEQKKTFVRLAVFEGSFSEEVARVVIEKDNLDTKHILKNLVSRSLIKQPTKHRYSIHLLIKHFLKDQQESENEIAERARAQMMRAEVLMVKYYLKLGHDLTMKSYSKDGYKANREALKQEAHNIQNVLKICCQQKDPTTSDIFDCLGHSKVYTNSARFFSLFVRTIIPGSIVDEFLQRCANLAEERKQHAIKINFDCLLADQERSKSIGKSDECFSSKIQEIKKEFETHYEDLKEDKSLCAHYYYQYGRYLARKSESRKDKTQLDLRVHAREQLEKSLELRKTLTDTPVGIADTVFSLLHLGNIWKIISTNEYHLRKTKDSKNSLRHAQKYYEEAIQLSKEHLGEHELTAACYKSLGDLFLKMINPKMAEKSYTFAKEMRENLELDASERHVLLLNNLGKSLTMIKRIDKAITVLQSARDMAEKLADSDDPNESKAKVYTSLAIAHHSVQGYSKDAVKYAKKALQFDGLQDVIKKYEYRELLKISS